MSICISLSPKQPGILNGCVQEMRGLLHDLMRKESKGTCLTCGADTNERLRMEVQLHKMTEAKEKLERNMKVKEEEAKKKDEQILDLTSKVRRRSIIILSLHMLPNLKYALTHNPISDSYRSLNL